MLAAAMLSIVNSPLNTCINRAVSTYFYSMFMRTGILVTWLFLLISGSACDGGDHKTQLALNSEVPASLAGKVVRVTDGDTFVLLGANKTQYKVRLYGIDCPERQQPFYKAAKDHLASLIFQKNVIVRKKNMDRYGRIVALVNSGNTIINEEMIRSGLAWHYKRFDRNENWSALEREAARKKLGLWSESDPTPPWEWKHAERRIQR